MRTFLFLDHDFDMNRRYRESCVQTVLSSWLSEISLGINLIIDSVYEFIELPLQNAFDYVGIFSVCECRRRSSLRFCKNWTQILSQSYLITFILYFIFLIFAQIFSTAIQRYYFIDPLLSNNRQCINIQFVSINKNGYVHNDSRLKDNFIRENSIVRNETYREDTFNYKQFYALLELLDDTHYMICQRSLYIYARFDVYSSLLHSNHTQFQFFLPQYSSTFTIDRPPFLDLCVHTSNRSHLNQIKSRLLVLSSKYYSSVNLFLIDYNFTQVSVTLYELDNNSTHLERVSIHTGWLREMYSQFYFLKYDHALSTVLFDGLAVKQRFVDYFDGIQIPLPADPLLGLNEMVQETLLVLPLC
jgi:hypothetical protein